MNGDEVLMNGNVVADDATDAPLAAPPQNEKHVTIDGPSLITDKMSVFMVRKVLVKKFFSLTNLEIWYFFSHFSAVSNSPHVFFMFYSFVRAFFGINAHHCAFFCHRFCRFLDFFNIYTRAQHCLLWRCRSSQRRNGDKTASL